MRGVKTPLLAGIAAAVASAAQLRRTAPLSTCGLRTSAEQLPAAVLDRLRHPSAPPNGYTVRWDPATRTALWQPNKEHR